MAGTPCWGSSNIAAARNCTLGAAQEHTMLWVMPSLPITSQVAGGLNAEAVSLCIVWLLNSP